MNYVSTRGQAPTLDFAGVLLAGLADDGGLYIPQTWPSFSPAAFRAMRGLSYPALAARIMRPFVGEGIPLEAMAEAAYAGFTNQAIVPLVQLETGLFVQELFHGPTLAFKDMAMQMLGRLFDHVLEQRGERVTIVGATSGDTGSAAIEAFAGRSRADMVILHPHNRTSEVQRRQMTTVAAPNVANVAVEGSFDDCQDLVKAMFADAKFRTEMHLSAVNSINWARIAAQVPYYVAAALALGAPDREVAFAVPTGNFGNVLAAFVAQKMGLPIAKLVIGSNRNNILSRFLASNDMSIAPVAPSLSPSMDIQVSSNFERLLFELLGRDGAATAACIAAFRATGKMPVPDASWRAASGLLTGFTLDDDSTLAEIRRIYAASGYLADPHTAVGIAAARAHPMPGVPMIVAGTAHPAKFPDAIDAAIGIRPPLPRHLSDLYERAETYTVLPNNLAAIQAQVRAVALRNR